VALCDFDGATVLLLKAPGGPIRPYKARLSLAKNGRDWGYFIRKGSATVRAKRQDERELLSLATTIPFDDLTNHRAHVSDISRDLVRTYLLEVRSDLASQVDNLSPEELGRQMNIVSGTTEDVCPINVGLLFFNPEPWRFFPVTQIDVVWFPEGTGGNNSSTLAVAFSFNFYFTDPTDPPTGGVVAGVGGADKEGPGTGIRFSAYTGSRGDS